MNDGWLTPQTAQPECVSKLAELRNATQRMPSEVEHIAVAQAVSTIDSAAWHLRTSPFTHSVGVVFPGNPPEPETWYICGSDSVEGYFVRNNVIPWTHWLGRVATRLRNAIEKGDRPASLLYGPTGGERDLPVGPLVDYIISDGRLQSLDFVKEEAGKPDEIPTEESPAEPQYGLKTIIQTLDLDQDDQIRGPMDGVFVLTGGPGVGKTTVALHRIPYLILEQNRSDSWETEPTSDEQPFFTADTTLVVVWKEHLVPYLRDCVQQLVRTFPDRNVKHIDKWVVEALRDYVRLGAGRDSWRLENDDRSLEKVKTSFTEQHVKQFLDGDHPVRRAAEDALRDSLPQRFSDLLTKRLEELGRLPRLPFNLPSLRFNISALEARRDGYLRQLLEPREAAKELSEMQQKELRSIRDSIQQGHRDALGQMSRYTDLLFDFYRSDSVDEVVRKLHGDGVAQLFRKSVTEQQAKRSLSRTDTYLLVWLIHVVTEDSSSTANQTKPLPSYSHVVIDEAQYYEPIVLRLFGELARLPDGVLTIVGDLEQRISAHGGLLSWSDVGFDLGPDRINRLVTNYRWTKEVFDFLELFHAAAGVSETLNRPLKWRIFGGRKPEIHTLGDFDAELEFLAKRISEMKDDPDAKGWTIIVVVPPALVEPSRGKLVELLESYFVESRWKTGEDVKESVDRVIVTDYDSIVGLEFDCVFAAGMHARLATASREDIQSAWVALTRAKRFVCVTRSGPDAIFSRQEFAEYNS